MKDEKHYFRVKYGFNAQDQVSIEVGGDLEKAIYAQRKGIPVKLGNSYINGRNIVSIVPHYHRHTGWHDWYEPKDGEDFAQIKRDCPNYDGVLDKYQDRVRFLIENNKDGLIGQNISIPELENRTNEFLPISEGAKKLADNFKIKND